MADSQNRTFLILIVIVALVVVVIFLQPAIEDELSPEPSRAWVAIEVDDSGVADVGPVDLEVGQTFQLHAVLEAVGRNQEPVYYTSAPALRFPDREVDSGRLRRWSRSRSIKIRWFTVEGERPFVRLDDGASLDAFTLKELVRSDWPLGWSIPGEIDAAFDNHLAPSGVLPRQLFGTQHYHVRVEIYTFEDDLIPRQVVRSWGAEDLLREPEDFPRVRLRAPGRLGPASLVFGLSQLEAPSTATEVLGAVDALARQGLLFSRATVIRDQIATVGKRLGDLEWGSVDLGGESRWGGDGGKGPEPGDLLRVGDRIVVLYADQGEIGVVDYDDWCFDFVQGASVRALGDVFSGEGLTVEWASLE